MNPLYFIFQSILVAILIVSSGCNKTENEIPFSIEQLDGRPILAAHRCNAPLKLQEAINEGINNYEVDIHVENKDGNTILMVGHELESGTGQNIVDYLNFLTKSNPNFKFLWMDFKNLDNAENEKNALKILAILDRIHNIKKRVLIEGQNPQFLAKFTKEGWRTSYYIPWQEFENNNEDLLKESAEKIISEMSTYGITGISYDAAVHKTIEKYFLNEKINDKKIRLHTWDLSIEFGDVKFTSKISQYNNTYVTLFSFPSENDI